MYAILLVVSSTMSVFFAFVLSEIMNCAAEGNLQRLMRVLIVGIVFLLAKYACYYQEEKLSNLFCKIFLRVYVLFFSAFIGSIISLFTHTIGDAKIGVFLFVILLCCI